MENHSCFSFSAGEVLSATAIDMGGQVLAVLTSLIAISFIAVFKQYQKFTYRLILYLQIAVLFVSLAFLMGTVPVYHNGNGVATIRKRTMGLCVAGGFLSQWSLLTEHLIVAWIVVYVLLLAAWNYNANKCKHEVWGILISVFLPLTFNWIPFIHNMYGLSGLYCWIRLTQDDCHSDYVFGATLQFMLLYVPIVLLVLFSLIVCTIAMARLRTAFTPAHHRHLLKRSLRLLVYPFIYAILWALVIINVIVHDVRIRKGDPPIFALWMAGVIAGPLRLLFPPVAYILHPQTLKKLCCKKEDENEDLTATVYVVSHENTFSKEETLKIRDGYSPVTASGYQALQELLS